MNETCSLNGRVEKKDHCDPNDILCLHHESGTQRVGRWPIDVTVWSLILWCEILFRGFSVRGEQHSVNLSTSHRFYRRNQGALCGQFKLPLHRIDPSLTWL